MARGTHLSVLALYNYDSSLFDNLVIPSGIDKTTLINNIILATVDFEVDLPEFDVFKEAIGIWSKARVKAWNNMYDVLYAKDYQPFINLSRNEKRREKETRDLNTTATGTDETRAIDYSTTRNQNNNITQITTNDSTQATSNDSTSTEIDDTTTNKISAFDSNTFENKEQVIQEGRNKTTSSGSNETTSSGSNETTSNGTENSTIEGNKSISSGNTSKTDNTGTIVREEDYSIEGDSAMYTKQNIIEQELKIRLDYDLIKIITDEFKKEFCLLIY